MKTNFINRLAVVAIVAMICFAVYSCQKENNNSSSTTTTSVSDADAAMHSDESTQADASYDDVEDVGMTAADEEGSISAPNGRLFPFPDLRLRIGDCASITVTPNDSTYPKTITIDFHDGCACADGKFRKGIIYVYLTGPIRRSGSVATITFHDFYLNNKHVEGSKIISNLSENGNIKFTVQVVGGKVTFPNGHGYKFEGLKYKHQVEGGNTATRFDDVYKIEGGSKTEYSNGITVKLDTDTPLVKKVSCSWISDGTLKIKINGHALSLNYGAPNNGDCDNLARLNWGDSSRLITLP